MCEIKVEQCTHSSHPLMIIPPIAYAVTFALFGPPLHFDTGSRGGPSDSFGPPPQIAVARIVPILVSLISLGIGIRQGLCFQSGAKSMSAIKNYRRGLMRN
jgi:hypothetical protein